MTARPSFAPAPDARSSLRPGTVYAIDGGDSFVYFGQVAPDGTFGFFRHRSEQANWAEAPQAKPMSRLIVQGASVGRALRSGSWLKLGVFPIHTSLSEKAIFAQWPVGTLAVTVWQGSNALKVTVAHDPSIQSLELMAAYDAVFHLPPRLVADFALAEGTFLRGSIWQARVTKEVTARDHPELPGHELPRGWIYVKNGI